MLGFQRCDGCGAAVFYPRVICPICGSADGQGSQSDPGLPAGAGEAHGHRNISQIPDLTVSAAAESEPRAYEMAGMGPQDVDVAILYDACTINTVLFLEDLGFCEKGEGGARKRGVLSSQVTAILGSESTL